MAVESEYVTASQAAQMIRVSTLQISRLIKKGILSSRPGADRRYKLIRRKDVEHYLEQHPLVPKNDPQAAA